MPEDASGGWRDEREHNGLSRGLETEDETEVPVSRSDEGQSKLMDQEMTAENISKLLADGGPEKQEEPEAHIENDAWAAYSISEDLNDLYEDNNEYWVLEVSEEGLDPVFVVRDDEIVTHPDYDVENDFQWMVEGDEINDHPFGILSYTGEEHLFANKEFRNGDLNVPVDGDQLEKVEQ